MAELIDKERAYTALKHEQYTHGLSFSAEAFEKAARIIDQMPTIEAEPVNLWIPVEDALPDSTEDVLVWFEYFRYGEYDCLYKTYGIGNYSKNYDNWMVNHETGWDQLRVIAWMPLPEPPEKE